MPRVPDEWVPVSIDANVRLRRHTEVGVLLLDVEIPIAHIVLSFDVSGSWAEALFEAYREHETECAVLPGFADGTGPGGRDSDRRKRPKSV